MSILLRAADTVTSAEHTLWEGEVTRGSIAITAIAVLRITATCRATTTVRDFTDGRGADLWRMHGGRDRDQRGTASYGPYFAMYPSYAAPAFWLTDYVIAANLQAAYEDRQAAASAQTGGAQQPDQNVASAPTPLTPEIKQAIAEEVKAQLAASQSAAAAQGNPNAASQPNAAEAAPPAMDPAQRVFIVSTNLDVPVNGDECGLTQGDVILRTGDTLDEGGKVGVSVMTSKANDCKSGSATKVAVADLQEMQNSFQEQVESGTQSMAANQGKNGMPVLACWLDNRCK